MSPDCVMVCKPLRWRRLPMAEIGERQCATFGEQRVAFPRNKATLTPFARREGVSHRGAMFNNRIPWQERFWRYVTPRTEAECWHWTGSRDQKGYGRLQRGGRNGGLIKAHRASYEIHYGPIATGLVVCHRCDTPPCVNPAHLFTGTMRDNSRDMAAKGRAAAQRGHDNGRTILTDEQVRDLRELAAQGVPYDTLSVKFGISDTSASEIARGNRRRRAGGPIVAPRTLEHVWRIRRERQTA